MQLNVSTTLPNLPNTAYTITRPVGCTPATSTTDSNTVSLDYLDIGALPPLALKGASFLVTPNAVSGGHCGLAANAFGSQAITPPAFGAGVGYWTHANGIYFDANGSICAESWHINPNTTEASGAWSDSLVIGTWTAGRTYQVDAVLYPDGAWKFSVLNSGTYRRDALGLPDQSAMKQFFSTAASATDPVLANRIRAASVKGRTNQIAAFIAGNGTTITVKPIAIYG